MIKFIRRFMESVGAGLESSHLQIVMGVTPMISAARLTAAVLLFKRCAVFKKSKNRNSV